MSSESSNVVFSNALGITNESTSKDNINGIVDGINMPIRKCMHAFMYFVLVILLIRFFRYNRVYLYSIVVSIIYAFTDEFHQLFVTGRTGQLMDIGIDMIGVLAIYTYGLLVKQRRLSINS